MNEFNSSLIVHHFSFIISRFLTHHDQSQDGQAHAERQRRGPRFVEPCHSGDGRDWRNPRTGDPIRFVRVQNIKGRIVEP